jgi:zinc transporter ZupT
MTYKLLTMEYAAPHDGDSAWWMPLLLSLLAGLSTSLGAAVVFCTAAADDPEVNEKRSCRRVVLRDEHLSFSLALAGAVMMTVSLVSILPECFHNVEWFSVTMTLRLAGISFGGILYW